MASKATIRVVPQHIPKDVKKVSIEADFDLLEGDVAPNDVHISIRQLSSFDGDWKKVVDTTYHYRNMIFPYEMKFEKPDEPGTYDIRVVFTLDGEPIRDGERIGQFFVDP